jgi:transcriptional accessory protein Tex/SPT6
VTNFGAFVDIGVHQDGLVHISELSHKFIEDPRKVVNPGDQVKVRVLKIDVEKNQIALTMKLEAPSAEVRFERQTSVKPMSKMMPKPTNKPVPNPMVKTQANRPSPSSSSQVNNVHKKDQVANKYEPRNEKSQAGGGSYQNKNVNAGKPAQKPFNNPFAALTQLKK